jgi:ecotropic viral integration site 5 protein
MTTKSPNMSIGIDPNHSVTDSVSASAGGSSPLDSLLSPRAATFDNYALTPKAVGESELREDVVDDESDFSMVPLSARQSTASIGSNVSIESIATQVGKEKKRRTTVLSMTRSESSTLARSLHKKSASASSDQSVTGNNSPFILARLESQKEQEEYGLQPHRASVDGQHQLQEEFVRMQNEIQEVDEESNIANTGIDWGVSIVNIPRT